MRNKEGTGAQYSNYKYDTASCGGVVRPHAVNTLTGGATARTYCYDANGNLTTATGAKYGAVTWYVANLAKRVTAGTTYSEFTYGADRARYKQYLFRTATNNETTLYAGGLFEKLTKVNGATTTEYTHYVRAGDNVVTISKRIAGVQSWRYLHRDHLGSVVALTDTGGALVERSGFDPWGKRTDYTTWNPPAPAAFLLGGSGAGGTTQAVTYTKRGFTGHEQVDDVGIVHMNGRIYDPELGKFMSADPTMQFPECVFVAEHRAQVRAVRWRVAKVLGLGDQQPTLGEKSGDGRDDAGGVRR